VEISTSLDTTTPDLEPITRLLTLLENAQGRLTQALRDVDAHSEETRRADTRQTMQRRLVEAQTRVRQLRNRINALSAQTRQVFSPMLNQALSQANALLSSLNEDNVDFAVVERNLGEIEENLRYMESACELFGSMDGLSESDARRVLLAQRIFALVIGDGAEERHYSSNQTVGVFLQLIDQVRNGGVITQAELNAILADNGITLQFNREFFAIVFTGERNGVGEESADFDNLLTGIECLFYSAVADGQMRDISLATIEQNPERLDSISTQLRDFVQRASNEQNFYIVDLGLASGIERDVARRVLSLQTSNIGLPTEDEISTCMRDRHLSRDEATSDLMLRSFLRHLNRTGTNGELVVSVRDTLRREGAQRAWDVLATQMIIDVYSHTQIDPRRQESPQRTEERRRATSQDMWTEVQTNADSREVLTAAIVDMVTNENAELDSQSVIRPRINVTQ